jgi:hypothetical protein
MTQTQVVSYLVEKLKEHGIIEYNKALLPYIGIEADATHIKRLSAYMKRQGSIRDKIFLKAIEERFGLSSNIWGLCDSSQKAQINKAVKHHRMLKRLSDKKALDVIEIIQSKHHITPDQEKMLHAFKLLENKRDIEEAIERMRTKHMLDKTLSNQEFLVALLQITYDKGYYAVINSLILPNLFGNYRALTHVQKIEAHTLGSLGRYAEAKYILYKLVHENIIENINLRTAALSNHKRELLESKEPIDKENLALLIQGYKRLHMLEGIYGYYTGINLLYLVILATTLYPDDERFLLIDKKEIYEKSKPSLKTDQTHHDYFAKMSELEFKLLLNYPAISEKIESFLACEMPHTSLVERTLRQMKLIIAHLHKSDDPLKLRLQSAADILEAYCQHYEPDEKSSI